MSSRAVTRRRTACASPSIPTATPSWPARSANSSRRWRSWSKSTAGMKRIQRAPRRVHSIDQRSPGGLGDYRIIRELGRGGMGVVYEAEQEDLGRHVALKVLNHHRDAGGIELIRLEHEAQAAAGLHHTNIVPIFGVGADEGVAFSAMQYIHGRGLDSVLREVEPVSAPMRSPCGPNPTSRPTRSIKPCAGLMNDRLCSGMTNGLRFQSLVAGNSARPNRLRPTAGEGRELVAFLRSSSLSILGCKEKQYYRSMRDWACRRRQRSPMHMNTA